MHLSVGIWKKRDRICCHKVGKQGWQSLLPSQEALVHLGQSSLRQETESRLRLVAVVLSRNRDEDGDMDVAGTLLSPLLLFWSLRLERQRKLHESSSALRLLCDCILCFEPKDLMLGMKS